MHTTFWQLRWSPQQYRVWHPTFMTIPFAGASVHVIPMFQLPCITPTWVLVSPKIFKIVCCFMQLVRAKVRTRKHLQRCVERWRAAANLRACTARNVRRLYLVRQAFTAWRKYPATMSKQAEQFALRKSRKRTRRWANRSKNELVFNAWARWQAAVFGRVTMSARLAGVELYRLRVLRAAFMRWSTLFRASSSLKLLYTYAEQFWLQFNRVKYYHQFVLSESSPLQYSIITRCYERVFGQSSVDLPDQREIQIFLNVVLSTLTSRLALEMDWAEAGLLKSVIFELTQRAPDKKTQAMWKSLQFRFSAKPIHSSARVTLVLLFLAIALCHIDCIFCELKQIYEPQSIVDVFWGFAVKVRSSVSITTPRLPWEPPTG